MAQIIMQKLNYIRSRTDRLAGMERDIEVAINNIEEVQV